MPDVTTTLPTEEGTYIFVGSRTGTGIVRASDLAREHRLPELVVVQRVDGRLTYFGRDFFYEPQSSRGTWSRVPDDLLKELDARAVNGPLLDAVAELARAHPNDRLWRSRHAILSHMTGGSWKDPEGPERAVAERAFDRAVALGYLAEDGAGGWRVVP